MIYRYMFMGYSEKSPVIIGGAYDRAALFSFGNQRFLYAESRSDCLNPNNFVSGEMLTFPSGENWIPMTDIFHYSVPLSNEHWQRKNADPEPVLSIVYLKPHEVARYVYHHFQAQEERHGPHGNKFGIIFLNGNQLVMYNEKPFEGDNEPYNGELTTSLKPENWGELMNSLFMPWEDFEGFWRPVELIQKINGTEGDNNEQQ